MGIQKFYICKKCGNLIGVIDDHRVPVSCCASTMEELVPNTVDAAQEKHLPVVSIDGKNINVKVGSAAHPMTDEHYITFIYIQTEQGGQRKKLFPGSNPEADFVLVDDKLLAVFAYCNLHGLWKVDV
ncbi:MAG: desulfoferrodoxin [Oscillospiraceae bacterium]|nr:desulfoferrodoxin [Oscillospiraceae bacterium]